MRESTEGNETGRRKQAGERPRPKRARPRGTSARLRPRPELSYLMGRPDGGAPVSGMVAMKLAVSSKMVPSAFVPK